MIAQAPGRLPLVGHLRQLHRDPLGFLRSLPPLGDLVEIRLGTEPAIVVCHPGPLRQVLLDDRTFDKGGPLFERGRVISEDGLVTCRYAAHRRQRRLAQPAFHQARMPDYARVMAEQVAARTDTWRDGQVIDVFAETSLLTSRILLRTLFADTLGPGDARALHADLDVLLPGLMRQILLPPVIRYLPGSGYHRFRAASARARRTIAASVPRGRACPGALLAALADVPDDELTNLLVTFFFAGTDTTAATLAWCLHLAAAHPAAVQRLPDSRFTDRFIAEVLRLYPPAWLLTRRTTRQATLADRSIPAGTTIVVSPYLIHHRADLYPEPERFDPDRPTPARDAYLPFGGGARRCIGDRFGTAELAIALRHITAEWTLETVRPPTAKVAMLIRPHGLLIRVHRRRR